MFFSPFTAIIQSLFILIDIEDFFLFETSLFFKTTVSRISILLRKQTGQ